MLAEIRRHFSTLTTNLNGLTAKTRFIPSNLNIVSSCILISHCILICQCKYWLSYLPRGHLKVLQYVLYLSFATCNSCHAASCNKLYWNSEKFLRKGSEPVSHQAKRPLLCQRSPLLSPCSVQAQLISCRNALAQINTNQTIFKSSNLNSWNGVLNRKVCRKSWRTCCLFLSTAARPVGPYSEDLWASQYPKRLGSGNAKECERSERNPDRRYPAHPSRLSTATRLMNKCFRIISMTEFQLDTISNQAPPMQLNILKQVWKSSKEFLLLGMVAILQIKTINEETFKHFTTGQKKWNIPTETVLAEQVSPEVFWAPCLEWTFASSNAMWI